MTTPRRWTLTELGQDAETAKREFRQTRLREPVEHYSAFFRSFAPIAAATIDRLGQLMADPIDARAVAEQVSDENQRVAFRYLAAPPISDDDLKNLAETTLRAPALRDDEAQAGRVRDVVSQLLDPHRFPWIAERRAPTESERHAGILSTTALIAARKVETWRRTNARTDQENAVKGLLRSAGVEEVPARHIEVLDSAPNPGTFCGESKLGNTRADLVVGLRDGRIVPIECKVSNSAVNSYKRINHEAAGKARAWVEAFGQRQVVPVAVISGVFNPDNLETAQEDGLVLIWRHRLSDLARLIDDPPPQ